MANKYIHNISGSQKVYLGVTLENGEFYQIPDSTIIKFQNDASVMSDILANSLRLSSDGITDYSTVNTINLNFLRNEHYEVDDEGRQVNRIAAASKGWSYLAHPIEFETANFGSLYEKNQAGTDRGFSSIKFYDINNAEVTDAQYGASIVKTVVLFKPSYDYELVAGNLQQITSPATDVRIWVVGGIIELGGAYVREFAGGLNMAYYSASESLKTDGRAAKYMKKDIAGVAYQANQLQVTVRHEAGVQHKLMLTLEYFRS